MSRVEATLDIDNDMFRFIPKLRRERLVVRVLVIQCSRDRFTYT